MLKDATPYNVQWRGSQPVFVDIGSFERLAKVSPGSATGSSACCSSIRSCSRRTAAFRSSPGYAEASTESRRPSSARSSLDETRSGAGCCSTSSSTRASSGATRIEGPRFAATWRGRVRPEARRATSRAPASSSPGCSPRASRVPGRDYRLDVQLRRRGDGREGGLRPARGRAAHGDAWSGTLAATRAASRASRPKHSTSSWPSTPTVPSSTRSTGRCGTRANPDDPAADRRPRRSVARDRMEQRGEGHPPRPRPAGPRRSAWRSSTTSRSRGTSLSASSSAGCTTSAARWSSSSPIETIRWCSACSAPSARTHIRTTRATPSSSCSRPASGSSTRSRCRPGRECSTTRTLHDGGPPSFRARLVQGDE